MRKLFLITLAIISTSCARSVLDTKSDGHNNEFVVGCAFERDCLTKTVLNNDLLSWSDNDQIGVFCSGRQYNKPFSHMSGDIFQGTFVKRGGESYSSNVEYYAYYPYAYNGKVTDYRIVSNLPSIQTAPYDAKSDFIVSDVLSAKYDEDDMPTLSFSMANHIFGIVKIRVVNSNPSLAAQKLKCVSLSASGAVLAGGFSFDMSDPTSSPEFSSSIASLSDKVTVRWTDDETLGCGIEHIVYAVVNEIDNHPISVNIKTDVCSYLLESSNSVTFGKGEIYVLPAIDLASVPAETRSIKTLAYWGDSIATTTLTDYLQWLLGDTWKVICCGASGDTPLEIAGRNGCIPMRIKESFTLPGNHNSKVYIGTELYSDWDVYGTYNPGKTGVGNKSWFNDGTTSRLNNCVVNGIDCMMTRDSDGKYYLQRLQDGNDEIIPALSAVQSFASLYLRDVDLLVTYMGTNGYGYESGPLSDATIANIYKEMTKYMEHTSSYSTGIAHNHIVVGFHHRKVGNHSWWSEAYHNYFTEQFGDRFLDLRLYGSSNAERLLVQTGVINAPSMMSELDRSLVEIGDWPASWQTDYQTNVHPNSYGSRAIAIMVYEKMKELGYLVD